MLASMAAFGGPFSLPKVMSKWQQFGMTNTQNDKLLVTLSSPLSPPMPATQLWHGLRVGIFSSVAVTAAFGAHATV